MEHRRRTIHAPARNLNRPESFMNTPALVLISSVREQQNFFVICGSLDRRTGYAMLKILATAWQGVFPHRIAGWFFTPTAGVASPDLR
ncbi:MAG: hypothetical protein A4E42_00969 [Methanoregulaceae archaeon PtaU1.Bin222]|nr:MAG: hypothetical protein A4E42_00969 [Methanoregulaceae archaeon PtaU1.Bin222]